MVRRFRRGVTTLGCLFAMMVISVVGYVAVTVGEVYWRYYSIRDSMRQEARFANNKSDEEIRSALQAKADSLGLPAQAQQISVERTGDGIAISTRYSERVEFPFVARVVSFEPAVSRRF